MSKSNFISKVTTVLKTCLNFIRTHDVLDHLVVAAVLLFIAIFGTRLIRKLTGVLHDRLAKFTPKWLLILNESFVEPLIMIVRVILLYGVIMVLPLPSSLSFVYSLAQKLLIAAIIFLLGWGFWRSETLCGLLLTNAQNRLDMETNRTMIQFFEKIYRAVVVILSLLGVLEVFGVPVAGLVAGAGVVGLAISLAAQSTLSSLIAGITLVLEHPFGIGDFVTLGSTQGIVEEVSFRSTRIRTLDNIHITVENSQVCSQYIQNLTTRTSRLLNFTIGVRYDSTPDQIRSLFVDLKEMLQNDPAVVEDSVNIAFTSFADCSLTLDIRCYVTTLVLTDYRDLQSRVNLSIMELVKKNGCDFAFPSTSIYMEPSAPQAIPENIQEPQA